MRLLVVLLVAFSQLPCLAQDIWGLDTTFGNSGIVTTDMGSTYDVSYSVMLQQDGKLVVAGYSDGTSFSRFSAARYNSDGSLDASFGSNGKALVGGGRAEFAMLQPDEKILLSGSIVNGSSSATAHALIRLNNNGTLDSTFGNNGKVISDFGDYEHRGFAVIVQPDGKIVQLGNLRHIISLFTLSRFNADGSLDSTFGINGRVFSDTFDFGECNALEIQPDGKLIFAGRVRNETTIGSTDWGVARYNPDGSIDNTFGENGWVFFDLEQGSESAAWLEMQPDGKLLITGRVDNNTQNRNFWLLRLNSDGSLDDTFGINGKISTDIGYDEFGVVTLLVPEQKILLCGWIFDDYTSLGLVRYNYDGSVDTTFGDNGKIITPVLYGGVSYSGLIQNDGKIVYSGFVQTELDFTISVMDFLLVRYMLYRDPNSINHTNVTSLFSIYPNPTTNVLNLTTGFNEETTFIVYDISGRLLQQGTYTNTIQINVADYPAGLYTIQCINQAGLVQKKWVKQ